MSDNDHLPRIKLGEHEYTVYEQSIGYLDRKLSRFGSRLLELDFSQGVGGAIRMNAYELLKVFIGERRMMPDYEFAGYESYTDSLDPDIEPSSEIGPKPSQVREALRVCMEVNQLDLFTDIVKKLSSLVDQEMIGAVLNQNLIEAIRDGSETDSSETTDASSSSTTTDATTATALSSLPAEPKTFSTPENSVAASSSES